MDVFRPLSGAHPDATEQYRRKGVSLVLPAFNEQEVIGKAIDEAVVALASLTDDFEIIVVDDGSSDETAKIAQSKSEQFCSVRLVQHPENFGYGAAIQTGIQQATMEYIAFTDADCQFDLGELDRFVLLAKTYDLVCGYRIDRKDTWLRCFISKVFNALTRILLGIRVRDIDCAFKLFRRRSFQEFSISSNGFLINSELLLFARDRELSTVEVGVTHRRRDLGSSTVSMSHIFPVLAGLLRIWWNKSMFAETNNSVVASRGSRRWRSRGLTAIVVVATAILLFTNLGYPLIDRDETRYAEIAREMVVTGNWVLPQLNFEPYYDKPPLFYWLCASSYKVFGVSEWSARIVPAMAGFLMVLATFWYARRTFGLRPAIISSIVFVTSAGFLFCGRFLFIDAVLSLLVTLSMFFAYEAIRSRELKLSWWIMSAVCCGLGVLAKGPVACVLLGPPVLAFAWLSNSHARIRVRHWLGFAAIVAGVAAPWFIAVAIYDSNFLYEFLYNHNVRRFAGAFHDKPFWFFAPVALALMHPWTCLATPCLSFLGKHGKNSREMRPQVLGYLMLWIGWCLLFFSLSRCKLPAYILPAAPAFALFVGYYLNLVIFEKSKEEAFRQARWLFPWTASIVTCVVGLALGGVVLGMSQEQPTTIALKAIPWLMGLIGLLVFYRVTRQPKIAWAVCTLAGFALAVQTTQDWVPTLGKDLTILAATDSLTNTLKNPGQPVATFNNEWAGIPFYLGRSDVLNFQSDETGKLANFVSVHPATILFVNKSADIGALVDSMPKGMTLEKVGERGTASIFVPKQVSVLIRTAAQIEPLIR